MEERGESGMYVSEEGARHLRVQITYTLTQTEFPNSWRRASHPLSAAIALLLHTA